MTSGAQLSRRQLLLGVALGAVALPAAGCSSTPAPVSAAVDPVRLETLGSELDLIAVYEATIAARPDLAAALTPLLDQHRAHAAALQVDDAAAATPAPRPPAAAADIAGLRELERQAAGLRAGACVRAQNPELAAMICHIGASEAQHVVVLSGVA